jgi:hypothetical protein
MFNLSVAFVVAWSGFWGGTTDKAKESVAELSARGLAVACEAYYVNPSSNNQPPKTLDDLVKPAFGGPSLVRNGAKDLLDPWGKKYQYAVGQDKDGSMMAFVWTERIVGGKVKVYGRKPPGKKS